MSAYSSSTHSYSCTPSLHSELSSYSGLSWLKEASSRERDLCPSVRPSVDLSRLLSRSCFIAEKMNRLTRKAKAILLYCTTYLCPPARLGGGVAGFWLYVEDGGAATGLDRAREGKGRVQITAELRFTLI